MWGIPAKWGFIQDLRDCVGKTIERVELTDLGFGYTISHAWTVKFTDGSRAFFGEHPSGGTALCPSEKAIAKSVIFTPEELGEVVADRMRRAQEQERRREEQDRRELERLQARYPAHTRSERKSPNDFNPQREYPNTYGAVANERETK